MASGDEYQQRQNFEPKLAWVSGRTLLPNLKTYLLTGLFESDIECAEVKGWGKLWRYKTDKLNKNK